MADGLRAVAAQPDPVGEVLEGWKRPNGLLIEKVRVPLGVVAVIYEARPNVTADVAGLCLKSGNVCILRGSSIALSSNKAIVEVLQTRRDRSRRAGVRHPTDPRCEPRVGDRTDAGEGIRRPARATRRQGADPEHRGQRDGSLHHRRRRQLPRVRRSCGRPEDGDGHRRERQDATPERVQRGRDAARPCRDRRQVVALDTRSSRRQGRRDPRRRARPRALVQSSAGDR